MSERCTDCRFLTDDLLCRRILYHERDAVLGDKWHPKNPYELRGEGGECGPEAKLFERRPPRSVWSRWSRFFGLFEFDISSPQHAGYQPTRSLDPTNPPQGGSGVPHKFKHAVFNPHAFANVNWDEVDRSSGPDSGPPPRR